MKPAAAAFADDEVEQKTKRPTLSWIPPSGGANQSLPLTSAASGVPDPQMVANLPLSEKKAIIKQIIERIPTNKEELFAYPIDWKAVDHVSPIFFQHNLTFELFYIDLSLPFQEFVNKRIRPWVDKKIVAYLGEAEATLSNFICEQVLDHKPPAKILSDIALVSLYLIPFLYSVMPPYAYDIPVLDAGSSSLRS